MPTVTPSVIAGCLRASGLRHAELAADSASKLVESIHAGAVSTSELLGVYEIRLRGLDAARSPHAASLHASTSEFVQGLRSAPSELLAIRIPDASPFSFTVFVTLDGAKAIGCMRVASKLEMTEDAWRQLWDGATA